MDKRVILVFALMIFLVFAFASANRELEATVTLSAVLGDGSNGVSSPGENLIYYLRILNRNVVNKSISQIGEGVDDGDEDDSENLVSDNERVFEGINFSRRISISRGGVMCFYKSLPIKINSYMWGSFADIDGINYAVHESGAFLGLTSSQVQRCENLNIDGKDFSSIMGFKVSDDSLWSEGSNFIIEILGMEYIFTVGRNNIFSGNNTHFGVNDTRILDFSIGDSKKLLISVRPYSGDIWGALPGSLRIESINLE